MKYNVYPVPYQLKDYVRYFWSIDFDDPVFNPKIIKIMADRYPRLIFQNLDNCKPITAADGENLPELFLSGIMTAHTAYTVKSAYSHFGVSFYPHALKTLFKIDAHELTNVNADLIDFCSKDLKQKLCDAPDHPARLDIVVTELISRLPYASSFSLFLNDHIALGGASEDWRIQNLMKQLRMSERQLERQFKKLIGVSPKSFLRITRFEATLRLVNNKSDASLADIAFQMNYADQPHFNKEFKSFSGFTPQQFYQRQKLGEESASFLLDT